MAKGKNQIKDIHATALETLKSSEKAGTVQIDPNDINWLKSANFMDHVNPEDKQMVSSKFDPEREPKVQEGLVLVESVFTNVNPLILLLAKFWENKTVRASIKNMIDKEAEEKGIDPVVYLQNDLKGPVEEMKNVVSAIERISYAVNYFKPRENAANKKQKQVEIDGKRYNVPILQLEELKKLHKDDRETFIAEVLKIATEIEIESL